MLRTYLNLQGCFILHREKTKCGFFRVLSVHGMFTEGERCLCAFCVELRMCEGNTFN